jgi:type IV pilus assembly protein PilX
MNKITVLKKQTGAILVVSLIMLLVMTLMGLSGMQTTSLQEKMSSNMRDQNIAFQAAESVLRDAEADIVSSGRVSGLTGMTNDCSSGLCYGGQNGISVDNILDDTNVYMANAVPYGTHSANPAITGISAQPKYLITGAKIKVPGAASIWKYVYQVTAIAQGKQDTTVSILNEVYVP